MKSLLNILAVAVVATVGVASAANAASPRRDSYGTAASERPGDIDTSAYLTSPDERQQLRGSALIMHNDDGMTHDER